MTVVSVQPLFTCNQGCSYCYLGELRSSTNILDLKVLEKRLKEILVCTPIDTIDIFGGEISLLNLEYQQKLISLCLDFCRNVNVTSNLQNISILEVIRKFPQVNLAISWNPERPDCSRIEDILNNQNKYLGYSIRKRTQILTVALPKILSMPVKELLEKYMNWKLPVTILRYFPSIHNEEFVIPSIKYEEFMINLISEYLGGNHNFLLNNYLQLKNTKRNPEMSSNLFIQPDGNYSWIKYIGNKENYIVSDKIETWLNSIQLEKTLYKNLCGNCAFYGNCLAEHLNFNDITSSSCCGLKNLLLWWYKYGVYFEL